MATTGVKIIDGDTAFDVYYGILDLYDDGESLETIYARYPLSAYDPSDDFEYEIYITACALAFWEIGAITGSMVEEVKKVIKKGACVRVWTNEKSFKAGEARQKELDKLLQKINSENIKIRKRKKYKTITSLLFYINDVLTFKLADNKYHATIVLGISQYRGACFYEFARIWYAGDGLPDLGAIQNSKIIGSKFRTLSKSQIAEIVALHEEEILKQNANVQTLLNEAAEKTNAFVIGLDKLGMEHRYLKKMADKIQKIGELQIKPEYLTSGEYQMTGNFDTFSEFFLNPDTNPHRQKMEQFNLKDLCY